MKTRIATFLAGALCASLVPLQLAACADQPVDEEDPGLLDVDGKADGVGQTCSPVTQLHGLAVVSNEIGVRLRRRPRLGAATVITTLLPNTVVRFLEHDDADLIGAAAGYRWQRVETVPGAGQQGGLRGWVATSAIDEDAFDDDPWFEAGDVAVVSSDDGVGLWGQPNFEGSWLATLEAGEAVHVYRTLTPSDLDPAFRWWRADTIPAPGQDGGLSGWVATGAVDDTWFDDDPWLELPEARAIVTTELGLNIRTAPNLSSSIITTLDAGTKVRYLPADRAGVVFDPGYLWQRVETVREGDQEGSVVGWVADRAVDQDAFDDDPWLRPECPVASAL
jgi:hypothetical protein